MHVAIRIQRSTSLLLPRGEQVYARSSVVLKWRGLKAVPGCLVGHVLSDPPLGDF